MTAYRILRRLLVVATSICAVVWVSHGAAQAATGIMSCQGRGAMGASKSPTDHIEVKSFQWGVGRGISSPTGGSADRESSAPSVSEIVITKTVDSTSPSFFKNAATAHTGIGTCTINFEKGSGPKTKGQEYLSITLTNVFVTKVSWSGSGGADNPTESLTLNFAKIEYKYYPQTGGTDPAARA